MIKMQWYRGTNNKKYKVILFKDGKEFKTVQFGDKRYGQFKDTTPLKFYSYKDHNSAKRRANYLKRHSKDYPKYSADWFSKRYLW